MRPSFALLVGGIWFGVALLLGATGVVAQLRPPAPQVILLGLTLALILAGLFLPPVRRWALTIDVRWLVALHLTRFVGAYFLYRYAHGELPYAFAFPGGIGDIIVAALAAVLLVTVRPITPNGRALYLVWNVLGLLDITGVVLTAATQGLADPPSMRALLELPLSLLPTFLVPLIIASHILIFVRLLRPLPAESSG
jgi:hypothetical protein